jgi:hypothetical protein
LPGAASRLVAAHDIDGCADHCATRRGAMRLNPILNAFACALLCAALAACDFNPEMNALPEPADQKAFQSEWKRGLSRHSTAPRR